MNDLSPPKIPALLRGSKLTPQLTSSDLDRLEIGKKTAKRILSSYPDYGKAPPEYLLSLTEFCAALTDDDRALLMDPVNGLAARCKFLPTKADAKELLDEAKAKRDAVSATRATGYKYFNEDEAIPQPLPAHRKEHVRKVLGYDPMDKKRTAAPAFVPTRDNLRKAIDGSFSLADLQTPAAPPSAALVALVRSREFG